MIANWRVVSTAVAFVAALIGCGVGPSKAQTFPDRPVRFVVPFAAGGALDVVARQVADKLGKTWSRPVVIENKPGANGIIGVDALMQSPADGYTIMFATSPVFTTNKLLYKTLPYDPDRDLIPVSLAAVAPNVLGIYPKLPIKSFKELIAYARTHPNELTFASQGNGSTGELTGMLLDQLAGLKMRHIPYRGASLAWNDVIAGHVDMMWMGCRRSSARSVPERFARSLSAAASGPARCPIFPPQPRKALRILSWRVGLPLLRRVGRPRRSCRPSPTRLRMRSIHRMFCALAYRRPAGRRHAAANAGFDPVDHRAVEARHRGGQRAHRVSAATLGHT